MTDLFQDFTPPSRRRPSGRTAVDIALGGLGISLATASASFAAYMMATAPAEVTGFGSKDFTIFAKFDRRSSPAARTTVASTFKAPPAAPPAPPPAVPDASTTLAAQAVDPSPTGSIPDTANGDPEAANTTLEPRSSDALRDFHLRNVVGDRALIEHRSELSLVRPGSVLAGAGEVLAIERRGDGWVVRTASGVIGGS